MSEKLRFIDATEGSPDYDSATYAEVEEVKADGIAYNYLNELEVIQDNGLQLIVKDGAMISRGRTYIQDEPADGASPKTLILDAATEGFYRIDRVVVEYDIPSGTASAKAVKGAEAAVTPTAPSLTDTSTVWHVSLALINIYGGEIASIEDERVIGNGRTSPVFLEDISAPNISTGELTADDITVKDSGKVYLNTEKTAYLRYTSNALYLKLPSCTEVQIPGVVVGTSSSAPSGTYPINTMYLERD